MICALPLVAAEPAVPTTVDFERHVMGLLSKAGCNAGNCHGSFQGKNGFRMSLFGFEPVMDYNALTRDNLGRRINLAHPDDSLFLLKATGKTLHEGGMRFSSDSWTNSVFKRWIEQGAKWTPGSGKISEITLSPADFLILPGGSTGPVTVTATYADGSKEDVTPFCDFKITDDAVASITPLGQVTAARPGDAGLTVLYRGSVRAIRVLVPSPTEAGFKYPDVPEVNFVDREVFTKLRKLNMIPSAVTSDEEFLRRVTIDTIGILPTPDEVRTFVADKDAAKRTKKIDTLLKHPLHAAVWATKMSDITGNNTESLEQPVNERFKKSQHWHDWLRKRFQDNTPYDQTVKQILTATSLDDRDPAEWLAFVKAIDAEPSHGFDSKYPEKKTLDLFWRRQQTVPVEQWGEKVAAAFLGVRLECCQCHKHPTDRWTQDEYWGFASIFSGIAFPNVNNADPTKSQFSKPSLKEVADAENVIRKGKTDGKNNNQVNYVRELFLQPGGPKPKANPVTNKSYTPKTLGGPEIEVKPGEDARAKLAGWITDPANPFFARSFVNRVWAHYFGLGIVHPVDDFSQANPPTNPRLLDALAAEFIKSGYDVRALERNILLSRTYQLSAKPNVTNLHDRNNFAKGYIRALSAEQVIDVLNSALGVDEDFGKAANLPGGRKMSEIGATMLGGTAGPANNNPQLGYILRIFGRPARSTACDCERSAEPALPQKLFLMTDTALMAKLKSPNGRIAELVKAKKSEEECVNELFLASLGRSPNAAEKAKSLEFLKDANNKSDALGDMIWALINTREFILNH